jgi:hypothetical protein
VKAYLSHPISGLDLSVVRAEALQRKEILQKSLGWDIVSPTEVMCCPDCMYGTDSRGHFHSWQDWMKADLQEMLKCYFIIMCPGWETSPGARLEQQVAVAVGMTMLVWSEANDYPQLFNAFNGTEYLLHD